MAVGGRILQFARNTFLDFLGKEEADEAVHRVYLLVFVSLIGTFTLLVLGTIASIEGNGLLAFLDLSLALILLGNLVHARRYRNFTGNIQVGIVCTALLFIFAFLTGGVGNSGFVWYFAFPLISSFLLGSKKGLVASLLLLLPALLLFAIDSPPPWLATYSTDFKIRFVPAFLVILAFSYLFERTKETFQAELAVNNIDLERKIEEVHRTEKALRESHLLLEERLRERTADLVEANESLEAEIAEKGQAERELARRNTVLTTLQETSLDGILVVDEKGRIISFNNRFRTLWGIPADLLVGASDDVALQFVLRNFSDPDSFLNGVQYLYDHPEEKSQEELELTDGRIFDRYSSPVIGAAGNYYGRVWYFRDITERKKAEDALRESEERYRTLIAQAAEGVLLLDPSGPEGPVIVEANEQACRDHGYSMKELIGMPISRLDAPESATEIAGRTQLLMKGGPVTFEARHVRKDGSTFPVEVSARLIQLGGRPCILAFDRDISMRKEAERALREAKGELERQNEELQKLDRMKDALISDVSHELKTPVAKHVMQLEILKNRLDGPTKESLDDVIAVMETSILRQQNVIRNILMMSRLESGPKEYTLSELRLDTMVGEILSDFAQSSDIYGISVTTSMKEVTVRGNREMLWHVFSNIIGNAVKYRPARDPSLEVEVKIAGDRGLAIFTDNGVGLTEAEREKAFERFYQASPAKEGIGLGLNISRMIIERFGGEIAIHSEGKGRGTSVVTKLPLSMPDTIIDI